MTWGVESHVVDRFGKAGVPAERVSFARDTFTFTYAGSPSDYVAVFRDFYGPTMNAFDAARNSGRAAELQSELEKLFAEKNTGRDGSTSIPATFLRVTVAN